MQNGLARLPRVTLATAYRKQEGTLGTGKKLLDDLAEDLLKRNKSQPPERRSMSGSQKGGAYARALARELPLEHGDLRAKSLRDSAPNSRGGR